MSLYKTGTFTVRDKNVVIQDGGQAIIVPLDQVDSFIETVNLVVFLSQ